MDRPFRIIGAGPAGLTAALTLARAGASVELYERNRWVGTRFGGDLHGVENWSSDTDFADELRMMGIRMDFECSPVRSVVLGSERRLSLVRCERPIFYVVSRGPQPGTLENALLEQAQAAGVQVHFGKARSPADADIVATGPDPARRFCVEVGLMFRTSAPDVAVAMVSAAAAPGGYCYLLVRNGVGCLCSVLFEHFREAKESLRHAQRLLLPFVGSDVRKVKSIGGYGSFRLRPNHTVGRALQVGEASGLQDFAWAFGIRSAIVSGHLSARASLENTDYRTVAADRFESFHRSTVVTRFVWERSASWALPLALTFFRNRRQSLSALPNVYRERALHRWLFPVARASLRRRFTQME